MAPTKPAATPADAAQIVWEHYGLRVAACKDLPSYDDRNFMMDVAAQDDAGADAAGGDGLGTTPRVALNRYVLKITNTEDSADTSLLEVRACVLW